MDNTVCVLLLFSSLFLLLILELKLEIHAFSSLQTDPSMEALSFFQPQLPSPFQCSFQLEPLPSYWFLPLLTQVGCDHSIQHTLLLCFHPSLYLHYLCVERLQALFMAPLLILN